jgi:hypothetical protein
MEGGVAAMARRKSAGAISWDFLLASLIELPIVLIFGPQKPLWQESPLLIALWVGGFALLFVVIFLFVHRRPPLNDFIAAGRKSISRKYPKADSPASTPPTRTSSISSKR